MTLSFFGQIVYKLKLTHSKCEEVGYFGVQTPIHAYIIYAMSLLTKLNSQEWVHKILDI